MVVRGDPVRPPGGGAALRRRQPEAAPGEGEAGRVPHPALRAPGLPGPPQGHDRGQPGEAVDGEATTLHRYTYTHIRQHLYTRTTMYDHIQARTLVHLLIIKKKITHFFKHCRLR